MKETVWLPQGTPFDFWEEETNYTRELHVSAERGREDGDGSAARPFARIQQAADIAAPATRVVIHGGVYRECVHPRTGGTDARHMVCYEAAAGETPVIKASEIIRDFSPSTGWRKQDRDGGASSARIWQWRLAPAMFCGYNPFCAINLIHDRLYIEYDKTDMTPYLNRRGMLFCDGRPLSQVPLFEHMCGDEYEESGAYWVESNGMTVHFRLPHDQDPQTHVIEATVREQCFAPEAPFLSFIKVKGLTCAHAANGAPIPQRGAISAFRGHHWVIEDCVVDWANTVGIDIGNECWHHDRIDGQQIGYSVIRGCTIRDAGVCGIAGLFATHMLIEDNLICGTGWQKMELSWEAGAVKLHNTVDTLFRRNIFKNTLRADHLWLDCGNENTRITQNLFIGGIHQREALFIECTRDEVNLIDHNIFWNVQGRFDESSVPAQPGSGGWYAMSERDIVNGYAIYGEGTDHLRIVGNLIGCCRSAGYFAKPVPFRMHGTERGGTSRDACLCGNIFYDCKEAAIKFPTRDNDADGNVYANLTGGYLRVMYPAPPQNLHLPAWREFFGFDQNGQEAWLDITLDEDNYTLRVDGAKTPVPGMKREVEKRHYVTDPDKLAPLDIDVLTDTTGLSECVLRDGDYFGNEIAGEQIAAGPFAALRGGQTIPIDPRKKRQAF